MITAAQVRAQIDLATTALTNVLTSPSPNHSISSPNGSRSVSKADYIKQLTEEIGALQELLQRVEPYRINTKVVV